MLHVHKKIKYALTALKYMKGKKGRELTTAKELSERFAIPFDPTSRVLQIMSQKGMLEAVQGAGGGYRLIGRLSSYSLYDLTCMIIGPFAVTDCAQKDGVCGHVDSCVLKKAMFRLNGKVLKVFQDTRLNEMI